MNQREASWSTIASLLEQRAREHPDDVAYTWLVDGDAREERVTYAELDARARSIATLLLERGARGARVLLLYPPGLEYVAAFFGCIYAGAVAVPAYPPDPTRLERTLPRLEAIVRDANATLALTVTAIHAMADFVFALAPRLGQLTWITTDGALPAAAALPSVTSDTVAFLQYTSGSTGSPKGVVLTHGNLLHNERLIADAFAHGEDTVVVGWLPLYHDMGLIGNMLQPLYLGRPCVLMSPIAFLQRPIRWLRAISRYGATTSGGPNFAYDLCARKATNDDIAALDLSKWRVAYNGAEPLRAATLDRFAHTFAPAGFDRRAFYPCYGLAEATLIVTGARAGTGPVTTSVDRAALERGDARPGELSLVSSGRVLGGQTVRIVDVASRSEVIERRVGEIWVRGGSVAQCYFGKDSSETFGAMLDGHAHLRTGDLGFFADRELYVTGRHKDLIIVRGRNIYPQDVETSTESVVGVRPGCIAAFAIDQNGEERIAIACEVSVKDDLDATAHAIVSATVAAHQLQPARIWLLGAGALPKTSSGKLQRRATKEQLESGELQPVFAWQETQGAAGHDAPTDLASDIRTVVERAIASASQRGFDSLAAVELQAELERAFGVEIPLATLLRAPAVDELVLAISTSSAAVPIARGVASTRVSLSDAQRAMWTAQTLHPNDVTLSLATTLRIRGPLCRDALERALAIVWRTHPLLGARIVGDALELSPHVELLASAEGLSTTPFHADEPLVRMALVSRGLDHHELTFVAHHVVVDYWSVALVLEAIFRAYEGTPPAAPELAWGDYVAWQTARATDASSRAHAYLEKTFAAPPVLSLPTRGERRGDFAPESHEAQLRIPLERVRSLSREHDVTPFTVLLAAWALLLGRLAGQDELIVGVPVSGRPRAALQGLVGTFVNTVAVPVVLGGSTSALLARVRESLLAALEHVDLPFQRVVEIVRPPRVYGRTPLFQTLLVHQQASGDARLGALALGLDGVTMQVGTLTLEPMRSPRSSQTDLTAMVVEVDDALLVSVRATAAIFERDFVDALPALWQETLFELAGDAPTVTSLPAQPRHVRAGSTLHEGVLARAASQPDAVAIVHGSRRVTYAALVAQASRIAHALRANGVDVEHRVLVALHRSADQIAAVLGVLLAGAAYVPLDPSTPAQRAHQIINDAQPKLLIVEPTETRFADTRARTLEQLRGDVPLRTVPSLAAAYVIYTSGSTGMPKGVVVSHAAAATFCAAFAVEHPLEPQDRVLQAASLAFDISVREIFCTLEQGATLVLVDSGTESDLDALLAVVRDKGVTVARFVPALLRLLVERGVPRLRRIYTGGESIEEHVVRRVSTELVHTYGPTEASVNVTTWRAIPLERDVYVPIGVPLPGVALYVLDEGLRPVRPGVPGELYVGGALVARGYLARPGGTATAFLPDPFAADGSRMYRTGDRVRTDSLGQLVFLGRTDHQVKVRGFRVELGEIESTLVAQPGVHAAVVRVVDQTLHAWVASTTAEADALRAALRDALPEYMVPAKIGVLPKLPVNAAGKIDRHALPPLVDAKPRRDPTTDSERALVDAWREVRREVPNLDEQFFALGGDSITALQIVAALRRRKIVLPVARLLDAPTLAAAARQARVDALASSHARVEGDVPLTPIQRRFFASSRSMPERYCQYVRVPLPGVGVARFEKAIARVAAAHDAFALRYEAVGATWRQWLDLGGARYAVSTHASSDVDSTAREQAALIDLRRGPLLRAVYLGEHDALLVAHHLVVDAVSWRILADELQGVLTDDRAVPRDSGFIARADRSPTSLPPLRANAPAWLIGGPSPHDSTVHRRGPIDTRQLPRGTADLDIALLCALAWAIDARFGDRSLVVHRELHGRQDDDAGAVGWFTTIAPSLLEHPLEGSPQARFDATARARETERSPAVVFNFLGLLTSDVAHTWGLVEDERVAKEHAVELIAWYDGADLHTEWRYARVADMPGLIDETWARLHALLAEPLVPTPLVSPSLSLDAADLDFIRAQLKR